MREWLIRKLSKSLEPEEIEVLFKDWISRLGEAESEELIKIIKELREAI